MIKRNLFLMIILMVLFCGCKPGHEKLAKNDMLKIVEANNLLIKEYFEKADIEKLALMYTDSAKLSPNGDNFVFGRDSIKAFWANDFKTSKVLEMTTTTLTVDGNNRVIYETGKATSRILYMDSVYTPTVKFINVWVKQDNGKYLLDVDFWNKDLPKK